MEREKENIRNIYIPNTETWVFEEDDNLIGFIAMIGNEVGAIFVRPDYHGQQVGTGLMDCVAQMHEGLEFEVFEKNTIGRAFYNKYGFKFFKESIHKEIGQKITETSLQ